jgi:hypothetical protein
MRFGQEIRVGILLMGLLGMLAFTGCTESGSAVSKDGPDAKMTVDGAMDTTASDPEDTATPELKLKLLSVEPKSDAPQGGKLATIRGAGFVAGARVFFGEVEAANVSVETQFLLTCTVPPGSPGKVDVTVTLPDDRTDTLEQAFTYVEWVTETLTLESIQPASGPASGGFLCVLSGAGFASGMTVKLGSSTAESVTVVSGSSAHFIAPAGTAGVVNVTLKLGDQSAVLADGFEYMPDQEKPPLAVSGVAPTSGPEGGGNLALLTGNGFAPGLTVQFGTESASVIEVSSTNSATVEVPAGSGKVDIIATLDDEVSILYDGYQYLSDEEVTPLTLSSLQPKSGPQTGGFLCVLSGTGFVPGIELTVGEQVVDFVTVLSADVLTFVAPPGPVGPADIKVAMGDTEATLAKALNYLPVETLALLAVEPATGPVAGGTLCLLKGAGFDAETGVYFGGKPAAVVEAPSAQLLVVESPAADGPGLVAVTVTGANAESAELADAFNYTETSVLQVSGVQPATGNVAGGYLVMLTGSGFKPGMGVSLCGISVPATQVLSENATVVTVPTTDVAGLCDIKVTNLDGSSFVLADGFLYEVDDVITEAPTIGLVSPKKGPIDGGTWVLVSGANFASGATVAFGATPAAAVQHINTNALLALTAPAAPGYASVKVTNPDGLSSTLSSAFNFYQLEGEAISLESIAPAGGPVTGGTMALISGANFQPGAALYVGGQPASQVKYVSASQLTVTVPPGPVGPADIVAVNPDGTTAVLASAFAYFEPQAGSAPPPAIAGVFPEYGPATGDDEVTLLGANFQNGALVFFDAVPVTVVDSQGSGLLTVLTLAHAVGSADVTIVNPDGQTATLADGYVFFVNPPFIGAVSPNQGPTPGGTAVTISGNGFVAGLKVYWDGKLQGGLIVSPPDQIQLVSPAGEPGTVSLSIVNPDGLTASLADAFEYFIPEEAPPPTAISISPIHGSAVGGYDVIVTGASFVNGAKVAFGQSLSPKVKFLSDQAMVASVPVGTPGASVDVTITNPDGQKDVLAAAFAYDALEKEPLSVISIMPPGGPAKGGTSVAVVGAGFVSGQTGLVIGNNPANNVQVVSSNLLTASAPPGPAGVANVTVTLGGEEAVLAAGYLYTQDEPVSTPPELLSVTPSAGPAMGGTVVQLSGLHFQPGAEVLFGGEPALDVAFDSNKRLLAKTPAHVQGTVSVVVINPDGAADILAAAFTFYDETGAKAPVVAGVVPDFGSALGGELISVTGAHFVPGLSVYLCGVPATEVTVSSSAQFTARTAAGPVGPCTVEVVNPDGQGGQLEAGFTYMAPKPTLTNVVPAEGPVEGGIEVVIYGTNFMAEMEVWFGVSKSEKVTVFDDKSAAAQVPPGLPGTVHVKAINPGGQATTKQNAFTYSEDPQVFLPPAIVAMVPASGPTAGNTVVSLVGANFQAGVQVMFNGTPAQDITYVDETSLLVVTPPGDEGAADVTVLNPDGQGVTESGAFAYVVPTKPAPKLFGMVPSSGPEGGGTTVLVTGANLSAKGMLYVNLQPVGQFTFLNSSVVSGVTPPGPPGPATVSFVGDDGQDAALQNGFTYIPAPKVESLSPELGPLDGGTEVTIVGQNFQPGAKVFFGAVEAAAANVQNSLIVVATTPAGEEAGAVDVIVVNSDGQTGVLDAGFSYLLAPEIVDIAPTSGPVGGGTPVSIWGANFGPGAQVLFGTTPADNVSVVDSTLIIAESPPGEAGLVSLTVANADAQKATLPGVFEYLPESGPVPVLDSLEPAAGPETGGTIVTLLGSNLDNPGTILLGEIPVTETVSIAANAVAFVTPVAKPGTVDVIFVSADGQSSTLEQAFEFIAMGELLPPPEIAAVAPGSGPTSGGTSGSVVGQAFQEGAKVYFGAIKAPTVTFVNDTQLDFKTPAHQAGSVDVTVLNPDGQTHVLMTSFTFVPPPEILDVSPPSGSPNGGFEVTITGVNFFAGENPADKTYVHICDDFAAEEGCEKILGGSIVAQSQTSIVYVSPAHLPGFVDVGVVNPDGQKTFSGGAYYYNEPPVLDSISPTSGPAIGGTSVAVNGSGFKAGMKVYFGETLSSDVTPISNEKVVAVSPAGTGGVVDITVENPDTTIDALSQAYTYVEAPAISKIFPASGPEEGGTQVTVEGEFFATGQVKPKVTVGNVELASEVVNVVSSKVIIITTPGGSGPAAITVVNPDGQQDTLAEAFVYVPPAPPPAMSYVVPSYGSGNGGDIVSIVGTGFMDGAQVYFGTPGAWVAGTNAKVKNLGTMITVTTPPHDTGLASVRVVNTNQQEVIGEGLFTFTEPQALPPLTFTSAAPNRAPVDGGVQISISGKGFKSGIKVYFGAEPVWVEGTNTSFLGPTLLHTTVPASPTGNAGTFDIRLLNPSAPESPDSTVGEDAFSYVSGGVFKLEGLRIPPDGRSDSGGEAADINNDGLLDVFITRGGYQEPAEYYVNATSDSWGFGGWFSWVAYLDSYHHPSDHMVTGDFDGDGDLDFLSHRNDRLRMMRNNGDGTFASPEDKGAIYGEARYMVTADFNCDGHLDIFVPEDSLGTSRPNLMLVNDGKGNFTHYSTSVLPAQYEYTEQASAADVDLDGDIDLLLANNSAMQNRLYLNNCGNIPSPPTCARKGDCQSLTFNDHTYSVCKSITRNWVDAKTECANRGMKLATINDAAEQAYINSQISGNHFWIGYNDRSVEGTWTWDFGDSTYEYWYGGQPDNAGGDPGEDCAALRYNNDGSWNDFPCTENHYYICEAEVDWCPDWNFTDAQYGPGKTFPISGFNAVWTALVDIDKNGYPDAIIANWGQQPRVYMNYGGSFENDDLAHWPQDESDARIARLYPVDVDLDGDIDIIAKVAEGDYVWARLYTNDLNNGGSGVFTRVDDAFPARQGDTQHIIVGDFDGDLLPDVWVVNGSHQDLLLINNGFADNVNWTDDYRVGVGKFSFNTQVGFPESITDSREVETGDLDGDGDLDLVRADWGASRLNIMINDGSGRFTDDSAARIDEVPYSLRTLSGDLLLDDMDGDGDLDIVVAGYRGCDWNLSEQHSRIRIFLNDGEGYFTDATEGNIPFYGNHSHRSLVSGDLNGDGKKDIVTVGWEHCYGHYAGKFQVLINGGDPFDVGEVYFFNKTSEWLGSYPTYPISGNLADLDNDGDLDMYLGRGDTNAQNALFFMEDKKLVDLTSSRLPSVSVNTQKVLIKDFDNDGDPDLYSLNWGQDRMYLQEIDHTFSDVTTSTVPTVSLQTRSGSVEDFDGDGLPDIFSVNYDQKNMLQLNLGQGYLSDASDNLPWDDDYSYDVATGDFDQDGDIDLYVCGAGLDRLYINTNQ